jgi:hypothetical protein
MPVEIRELVIKAQVSQDKNEVAKSDDTTSNNTVTSSQELITAFIEKIMEIQKDKKER